jgi:hypothetical protein
LNILKNLYLAQWNLKNKRNFTFSFTLRWYLIFAFIFFISIALFTFFTTLFIIIALITYINQFFISCIFFNISIKYNKISCLKWLFELDQITENKISYFFLWYFIWIKLFASLLKYFNFFSRKTCSFDFLGIDLSTKTGGWIISILSYKKRNIYFFIWNSWKNLTLDLFILKIRFESILASVNWSFFTSSIIKSFFNYINISFTES